MSTNTQLGLVNLGGWPGDEAIGLPVLDYLVCRKAQLFIKNY